MRNVIHVFDNSNGGAFCSSKAELMSVFHNADLFKTFKSQLLFLIKILKELNIENDIMIEIQWNGDYSSINNSNTLAYLRDI